MSESEKMKLKELLSILPEFPGLSVPEAVGSSPVIQISVDSRKVDKNSVFVAIRGSQVDSHRYLSEVLEKNPLAVVFEGDDGFGENSTTLKLQVKNSREALDLLASRFYGDPSRQLLMFGVTGTNGKTSSTYLFEHIFTSMGFPTGVIGGNRHFLGTQSWPTGNTTPGSLELQGRLAEMRDLGAKAVAMEVTSHALDQRRADSVHFNVVLFTNLTRDHMDYHKDMPKYFAAKQRLFTDLLWKSGKVPHNAVINIDDPYGRRLRVAGFAGLWTFGKCKTADFQFEITSGDFASTQFHLKTPKGQLNASVPLCGLHNVYNVVGVLAAVASLGIPVDYAVRALQNFPGVPGRLQKVKVPGDLNVFVDYAHTPDALENVLKALKEIRRQKESSQRIITVFGCGGDRDKGKRPQMAKVAEEHSDLIVVTSDNPRTEDPMSIISDIMAGFIKMKPFVEQDRRAAIALALHQARPGDVVLVAGKGHEDYQILGTEKIHFSDLEAVQEILS